MAEKLSKVTISKLAGDIQMAEEIAFFFLDLLEFLCLLQMIYVREF